MDNKDLYDCLAKQAEMGFNSFVARREHQWKISVGLWAVILLTTEFFLKDSIVLPWYFLLVFAFVIAIHCAFVAGVWRKSEYDESLFRHYRDRCADLLESKLSASSAPHELALWESWRCLKHGASQFQIAATIALCFVCSYAIYKVGNGHTTPGKTSSVVATGCAPAKPTLPAAP